jgi:F-type H+-transporting ATPase subunit b
MAILYDTYFVVALAFFLFMGLLYRLNVHKMAVKALDDRAERIRHELDEARRLREEAQSLLASYERRQKEVEAQAADILARATADARTAAEAAKAELAVSMDRRIRSAQEQIASAEAAAVRDIRNQAVTVAVAAAAEALKGAMTPAADNARIDAAIAEVGARLH